MEQVNSYRQHMSGVVTTVPHISTADQRRLRNERAEVSSVSPVQSEFTFGGEWYGVIDVHGFAESGSKWIGGPSKGVN